MAVIISDNTNSSYDGKLSTSNGFYRCEAYNLGAFSTTGLSLSSTNRTYINTTFANSGNCKGVVLYVHSSYTPVNDRSITVDLQEGTTVTITIASPGVINWTGHGLADGTPIIFTTTGALPTGITAGTVYYVKTPLTDSFNIAATVGGAAINFSGTQSGVQTAWVVRATSTLTASQIVVGTTNVSNCWIPAFSFTTPYAVDTTVGRWRFSLLMTAGTAGTWRIATSDATNPFYVTWCDTKISFTNNDTVICKDIVTIDQSATFKGTLGTGETAYAVCCVLCNSASLLENSIGTLLWQNPPVSSYTLTIDGRILYGSGSAMRIGTSTNPIPYAQQAIVDFVTPTVGTSTVSGYSAAIVSNWYTTNAFFAYGATPTLRKTTLNGDANSSQAVITTTDSTGWAIGDKLIITKEDNTAATDKNLYTIQNISGTSITLTGNLAVKRKSGATVINCTGYGVFLTSSTSATSYGVISSVYPCRHWHLSGCWIDDVTFTLGATGDSAFGAYRDDLAYTSVTTLEKCVFTINAVISLYLATIQCLYDRAALFDSLYGYAPSFLRDSTTIGGLQQRIVCSNCVVYGTTQSRLILMTTTACWTVSGCTFENVSTAIFQVNGYDPIIIDNTFYGGTASFATVSWMDFAANKYSGVGYFARNRYNRLGRVYMWFSGAFSGAFKESNSIYGDEAANTNGFSIGTGCLLDVEIENCTGTIATNLMSMSQESIVGTKVRLTNYNGTTNNDYVYLTYGNIVRTGDGLTDTTVHTSGTGKFAMRWEPTSSLYNLDWSFNVPTGNIQNKTMTVAVWCKINSANYYSGTYQLPRLTINYDNGTTAYCQAATTTDWQLLFVNFTPTTTYGQITVTVSGRTDATSTDAYFYVDDFAVLYPAGYKLDLGGMDLWANALPVTPPIATVLSAKDVWTALTTENYGANTIGNAITTNLDAKVSEAGGAGQIKYIVGGEIPIY